MTLPRCTQLIVRIIVVQLDFTSFNKMNYDQIKLESVLNNVYNNKFSVNNDLRQLLLDFVKEEGNNLIINI